MILIQPVVLTGAEEFVVIIHLNGRRKGDLFACLMRLTESGKAKVGRHCWCFLFWINRPQTEQTPDDKEITDAASPTFAIMAAPASLTLAGYLTISGVSANLYLVSVLTPQAVLMTGLVWVAMVRLLRLPFSPGYAAFTFLMVIGATALLKLEVLLNTLGMDYPEILPFGLARLGLVVATVTVAYVAGRYLNHYGRLVTK